MTYNDILGGGLTSNPLRPTRKELSEGNEVDVLTKTSNNNLRGLREIYDNEASFLEQSTRAGLVIIPKLFEYKYPSITMEHIQGQQFRDYNRFGSEQFGLKYPDDIEIMIKTPAAYVRTMANVMAKLNMIKERDNKPIDMVIMGRSLDEIGDLVILDWGLVKPVQEYSMGLVISEIVDNFIALEPAEANPGNYQSNRLRLGNVKNYFEATRFSEELKLGKESGHYIDNPRWVDAELGRQVSKLKLAEGYITRWLETAPDTPYKKLIQRLVGNDYGSAPQQFVRDLVEYQNWLVSLNSVSRQDLERYETAFQDMLSWTGDRWSEGGIDLNTAKPWIKHLDLENIVTQE